MKIAIQNAIYAVCGLALVLMVVFSLVAAVKWTFFTPSNTELCESIGYKYQWSHKAPGYKLCYRPSADGSIEYTNVPNPK